jgi:spermidine synthase
MRLSTATAALLLLGSGLCALIYQVAWFRELRLVFGASTPATAAVLAIFIGGLGLGGLYWGPRVDRSPRPLLVYAHLEAAIAVSVALTPFLLSAVRWVYVAAGGTTQMGMVLGTVARLLLAALVLGPPTLLMGGTLPAMVRAVESSQDPSRRRLGLLYGMNTLGAVAGTLLSSFVLLEVLGTRLTLWSACLLNLLVAVLARAISRRLAVQDAAPAPAEPPRPEPSPLPAPPRWRTHFVLGSAAAVGFAFFLMELVWYRMLAPILGGTVFTFGLILAFALLGIALGGAYFGRSSEEEARPSLALFGATCLLEAAALSLPFALGDRVAVLALLLRPLGSFGFWGFVLGWGLVAALVVLPAAFMAGVQFPALIALLGKGEEQVGRHVGLAYAWNTAGAITGSLAGGFGLLPALTAVGCWKLVGYLLLGLGLAATVLAALETRSPRRLLGPALAAVATVWFLSALGPTAAWRHTGIGAGRVELGAVRTAPAIENFLRGTRRTTPWEADGVETSVAINNVSSYSLITNGKSDGNLRNDASTMIMGGLLGAMVLPDEAKHALVIGLGTGASGGWLGDVPSMERVDVVELEGAVDEVARRCAPISRWWPERNPRLRLTINDARETILTTRQRYDVIMSEPSNPYRAGVASLFTAEFYRAVQDRLTPDGVLAQWIQIYDIDTATLRTVYATLTSVFPEVETWSVGPGDLILLASREPIPHDAERLRARIQQEPYRSALAYTWRAADLEAVLAHHLAGPTFARAMREAHGDAPLNTDDQTVIEFGFGRTVGGLLGQGTGDVLQAARSRGMDRAAVRGEVDWDRVEDERVLMSGLYRMPGQLAGRTPRAAQLARALVLVEEGNARGAAAAWPGLAEPRGLLETGYAAEILAATGSPEAERQVAQLAPLVPAEASALEAVLRLSQGKADEAAAALERALVQYRSDPWPQVRVMTRALQLSRELAARGPPDRAARLAAALEEPFVTEILDQNRLETLFQIASRLPDPAACARAVARFEPHVPWTLEHLGRRAACYRQVGDPRAALAEADLDALLESLPEPLEVRPR